MRKSTKILLILGLILLFFPLFFTLIENQAAGSASLHFMSLGEYPLVGRWMPTFLFWTSVGFMVLLVVGIFIILFFPKAESELVLEKENGRLVIQRKALENFVLQTVKEEPFIADPNVKVKFKKNRIKVLVSGKMRKVFQLTDRQEELTGAIQKNIAMLMGTKENILTEVTFKGFNHEKRNPQQPRVE